MAHHEFIETYNKLNNEQRHSYFLEHLELLPQQVQRTIKDCWLNFEELDAYEICRQTAQKLQPLGWSVEYGLDAELYNLRPLGFQTLEAAS